MIFFTSDNHFGHFNVIDYAKRPFRTLDEMHIKMIDNWNKKVSPKDTVYHLGDFFLSNNLYFINTILGALNGQIRLLRGNHDRWIDKLDRLENASKIILEPELKEIKMPINLFPGRTISIPVTMCHYPMLEWNKAHYGAINLHGHSHGKRDEYNKAQDLIRVDVGVDSHGFAPITFEEICRFNREKIEKFQSGQEFNHHKEI
jgi:calcineurin-like phosphoesterase family protein